MTKVVYLGPYQNFYEDAKAETEGKAKHPGDTMDLTQESLRILRAHGHRFADADDKQAAKTAATSTTPATPPAPAT